MGEDSSVLGTNETCDKRVKPGRFQNSSKTTAIATVDHRDPAKVREFFNLFIADCQTILLKKFLARKPPGMYKTLGNNRIFSISTIANITNINSTSDYVMSNRPKNPSSPADSLGIQEQRCHRDPDCKSVVGKGRQNPEDQFFLFLFLHLKRHSNLGGGNSNIFYFRPCSRN